MLVDQLSTRLAEQEDSPLLAGELRPVIDRSLSQGWIDEQLTLLADELDRWLAASNNDLPDRVIDLTPVKGSLAADGEALSLIAEAMDCGSPQCPSPESALIEMLAGVPHEVALLTIGAESDTDPGREILKARDQFQTIDRLIALVPLVLVAELATMVLFARRGSRIRGLGTALVVIAVPVLAMVDTAARVGLSVGRGFASRRDSIQSGLPRRSVHLSYPTGGISGPVDAGRRRRCIGPFNNSRRPPAPPGLRRMAPLPARSPH